MKMEEEKPCSFAYAPDGLQQVRALFIKHPPVSNFVKVPEELLYFLRAAKERNPLAEIITSKYNISVLIRWVIDDILELNASIFDFEESELNIILAIITMMEMHQLIKAANANQTRELGPDLEDIFRERCVEASRNCAEFCSKIKDNRCKIISQNTTKSRDILLQQKASIIKQNKKLVSPLIQLDLHCVFSNMLLNLRRLIRSIWKEKSAELISFSKSMKLLELKLYYLSVSTFKVTESYVRQLSDDVFSNERKVTYVYLLYDEKGIHKISKYLEEAPMKQLQKDMDLLSEVINQRYINSRRQISS